MFKFFAICLFAVLACAMAKPAIVAAPLAYSAPYVAAPYTAAYAAPYTAAYTAPYAAAAYSAYPYASAYSAYPYATAFLR
ncbi:cuticle protein 4.9-like [Musca vetustissima]|uniref:cuticle protein 4.9-like n=1 Tax=Musca vetustissima TaxID=27455 RepID=UPI002AB62C1E|nr:cuticle protein 4.9-like [Musca vetustissima]